MSIGGIEKNDKNHIYNDTDHFGTPFEDLKSKVFPKPQWTGRMGPN